MKQFFDASSEIEYLTKCAVYDFAEQWTAGFSRHYFSRASARERATAQAEACAPQCRLKPAVHCLMQIVEKCCRGAMNRALPAFESEYSLL